jgi:hypothetical protein
MSVVRFLHLSFVMLTCRVSKPSLTLRRRTLARRILSEGWKAMVVCSACTRSGTMYMFAPHSSKYVECTRKGIFCNGSFSEIDYDKLSIEQAKLETTHFRIIAEVF